MSQVFLKGKRIPVTLLNVPQHAVVGYRTPEKDGYKATIVGIGQNKKPANNPLAGQLKKKGIKFTPKYLKEIKTNQEKDLPIADQINLKDILVSGSTISVTGTSKGKGFTGTIKRWNFAAQPRTHGQSDRRRAPGSIGRGTTPGRVLPGKKMAGRHGNQMINVSNLKIISFDQESGNLVVSGPVPGAKNSLVKLTITKRSSDQDKNSKS